MRSFDHPNLTFQGGSFQDVPALIPALSALGRQLEPSEVVVDGWSCYQPSNTVFLKVALADQLQQVQHKVHALLEGHCQDLFAHYLPTEWQPHITVAMDDLSDVGFDRARRALRAYHPRYRQVLSNLHLVELPQEPSCVEIACRFMLGRQ